jgi:hypothetical protein
MSPEQKAALEAIGVKFGTGELLRDFTPVRQRPWWLAFLWRQFYRIFPETENRALQSLTATTVPDHTRL